VRIHIAAPGRPAPQGSKEQGGAGQLLESSIYLPAWRAAVKIAAFAAYKAAGVDPSRLPLFPAGTPVTIELCTFYVGPEQCRAEGTDEPIGPPDVDKLLRAVLDALGGAKHRKNSARLYADDAQVKRIRDLSKERALAGQTGVYMIISDGRD
jgi:Holliday junction resolvase RusA-like endonuclease